MWLRDNKDMLHGPIPSGDPCIQQLIRENPVKHIAQTALRTLGSTSVRGRKKVQLIDVSPAGRLVKAREAAAVYLVRNCRKHLVMSMAVIRAHNASITDILKVPDWVLNVYPRGDDLSS